MDTINVLILGEYNTPYIPILERMLPSHTFYNLLTKAKEVKGEIQIAVLSAKWIIDVSKQKSPSRKFITKLRDMIHSPNLKVIITSVIPELLNEVRHLADESFTNPLSYVPSDGTTEKRIEETAHIFVDAIKKLYPA